jgi:arylsulfatase
MFVKDGKLAFAYNFLGIPPEQRLVYDAPKAGKHVVGVEFEKKRMGKNLEVLGRLKLYIDETVVNEADFRTQSSRYALCGEGLAIGRDAGDPVSSEYGAGFTFSGGMIEKVIFDVAKDTYIDAERELAAAMARD